MREEEQGYTKKMMSISESLAVELVTSLTQTMKEKIKQTI